MMMRPHPAGRPGRKAAFLRLPLSALLLSACCLAAPGLALAAPPAKAAPANAAADKDRPSRMGDFGSSKEPIKIDSDRLDVFDKDGKAVFAGNVVAVQGDSTMRCAVMTVFYEQAAKGANAAPAQQAVGPSGGNSIKKIDCKGPVTIVSKTQTATGNNAEFDRAANKVYLIGNVTLSDGQNVTRGNRLVYDLNSSIANVESTPGVRVQSLFVPGGGKKDEAGAKPKN